MTALMPIGELTTDWYSRTFLYTEGWTNPIRRQLLSDGLPYDASDLTIGLDLRDRTGAVVSTAGKVSWFDDVTAYAQFEPGPSDLTQAGSPYHARWQITDVNGKVAFHPQDLPETWKVTI